VTYRDLGTPAPERDLSRTWAQDSLAWKINDTPEAENPALRRRAGGRWWFGPLTVKVPADGLAPEWEYIQGVTRADVEYLRGSVLWLLDLDTPRWRTGPCPHRERWQIECFGSVQCTERLPAVRCDCEEYPALPSLWSPHVAQRFASVLHLTALLALLLHH
jgi:hypothetical protein